MKSCLAHLGFSKNRRHLLQLWQMSLKNDIPEHHTWEIEVHTKDLSHLTVCSVFIPFLRRPAGEMSALDQKPPDNSTGWSRPALKQNAHCPGCGREFSSVISGLRGNKRVASTCVLQETKAISAGGTFKRKMIHPASPTLTVFQVPFSWLQDLLPAWTHCKMDPRRSIGKITNSYLQSDWGFWGAEEKLFQ